MDKDYFKTGGIKRTTKIVEALVPGALIFVNDVQK